MFEPLTRTRRDGLIPFFILTYAITWGIGALAILFPAWVQSIFGELTQYNPLTILAVAAPTVSASILVYVKQGWPGLRALYSGLVRWRVGIWWYALILITLPVTGCLVGQFIGSEPKYDLSTLPLIVSTLLYLLVFGPLLEELGWRGYALPRLLVRFSPFVASLVLGLIWGIWHLPSFFISSLVQSGLSLPVFLLMGLSTSVVLTWIFEHTSQSVLIAVLFHFAVNFNISIIGVPLPAMAGIMLGCAVLVVLIDSRFGWFRKPDQLTGGVRQKSKDANVPSTLSQEA